MKKDSITIEILDYWYKNGLVYILLNINNELWLLKRKVTHEEIT